MQSSDEAALAPELAVVESVLDRSPDLADFELHSAEIEEPEPRFENAVALPIDVAKLEYRSPRSEVMKVFIQYADPRGWDEMASVNGYEVSLLGEPDERVAVNEQDAFVQVLVLDVDDQRMVNFIVEKPRWNPTARVQVPVQVVISAALDLSRRL